EEVRVGTACYIPGAEDRLGRRNERDLKNYTAQAEAKTLLGFIEMIQERCAEYNANLIISPGARRVPTTREEKLGLRTDLLGAIRRQLVEPVSNGGLGLAEIPSGLVEYRQVDRTEIIKRFVEGASDANLFKDARVSFLNEPAIDA